MANNRVFNVQALVTNTVSVGGLAALGFDASYRDVIVSEPDGAAGVEDVDRTGLRVAANLSCTDVAKANAILDGTVGDTTFSGQESGASGYKDYTVPGIVWSGMNLSLPRNADGTLGLNGVVRMADGTKTLADIFSVADDATAPTQTYPARLYRPNTASFDPTGADPAINPAHLESVTLSLVAEMFEDYSDTDIGLTAVDRGAWGALQVSLSFKDYSHATGVDMCAQLTDADRGALTATLLGRAGAANKTLTVNNLLWTGSDRAKQKDHWLFTVSGQAAWKEGATTYTLNGATKLFSIA